MKKLLITRPDHDDATYYLYNWSKEIIAAAHKKSVKVLDLPREKANKKFFISYVDSKQPKLIILNGHGNENAVFGYKDEVIIDKTVEKRRVKNKIIYTIACSAAGGLGKELVKKGCSSFIGYTEEFVFFIDENSIANPLNDRLVRPFFESTNRVPISLIKGNTTSESVEKAKKEFMKQIIKWRGSKELEAPFIINALLTDMDSLVLYGSGDERF